MGTEVLRAGALVPRVKHKPGHLIRAALTSNQSLHRQWLDRPPPAPRWRANKNGAEVNSVDFR